MSARREGPGTRSRLGARRGNALIEASIALPLLVILLLGVVNFGFYIFDWITIVNAARAAAEYQVLNHLAVGHPSPPNYGQVLLNFTADVSSLSNPASATLEICNFSPTNGTTCNGSGPAMAATDPYGYTLYGVAVQYPFTPVIPVPFLPAQTISQIVYMRSLQ